MKIVHLQSVSEMHQLLDIPGPLHPLITVLDATTGQIDMNRLPDSYTLNFYKISFITKLGGQFRYGQAHYDFNEGSLLFVAPNQLVGGGSSYIDNEGYSILFHPDFLLGYSLATKIKQYGFFSYAVNEALHLSGKEKKILLGIFQNIQLELESQIDDFSHEVVIAQLELLLTYAGRFYKRQFLTRKVVTNDLLLKVEALLNAYFESEKTDSYGLPTVQYLAEQLNYTPNYLSDMLRSLTGQNAQQHIHQKLIERSKELLSVTNLSVNEIAYQLGFEHPQSFSRLFKNKTKMSPAQFKASFNHDSLP